MTDEEFIKKLEMDIQILKEQLKDARWEASNANHKLSETKGKVYEALGFSFSYCCRLIEEGKDPRMQPITDLVTEAKQKLKLKDF